MGAKANDATIKIPKKFIHVMDKIREIFMVLEKVKYANGRRQPRMDWPK